VKQKEEGFRKTNETSELQTVTFQRKKLFRFLQTLACRTAGTFEDQKSASSSWSSDCTTVILTQLVYILVMRIKSFRYVHQSMAKWSFWYCGKFSKWSRLNPRMMFEDAKFQTKLSYKNKIDTVRWCLYYLGDIYACRPRSVWRERFVTGLRFT
jgi:hypothetical protein